MCCVLIAGSGWSVPGSAQNATCPFCTRSFVNNANLKIHVRDVHSVNKGPFVCGICGKVVKNKGSLRVHVYRFHSMKAQEIRQSMHQSFDPDSR
ncbi:Zinc finger protein 32 [Blattella germanica]|nr:Zinc finger protein 32 [Blattella germanica]